jgi:hypothetical protein
MLPPRPDNLSIPQRFVYATGETLRQWAFLEFQLHFWLAGLSQTEHFRARIIWFSLPNFRARQTLLQRLAETYLDEESLRRFRTLLKRTSKLATKRNALAHTAWAGIEHRRITLVFDDVDDDMGFNFARQRSFDINNIEHFPHAIARLTYDLTRLLIDAKVFASAKIHREPHADPSPKNAPDQPESSS